MAFLKKRGDIWHIFWQQDGKKHGRSLRTKSKRVADEYLKQFEYKLSQKQLGQQTDITLDLLRDEYLSYSKATKKQSAYERHDVPRVGRFVCYLDQAGVRKASRITQAHIETYQQQLAEQFAPQTVRNCLYAASGLLSFAVRRGYLASNVVRNVQKVKCEKNPPRYLSHGEWRKVEEIARPTYLWPLVATAYYAGFRNSELRFLTWPEIDADHDWITLTNKKGFSLKNRTSRSVPLNERLKSILQPLARASGYCFANRNGKQFGAQELSAEFKRSVVKPSGLPYFSLHTLRHTFASHLVMAGVSIYKVSQWLGHKDVTTTMAYAHLAPRMTRSTFCRPLIALGATQGDGDGGIASGDYRQSARAITSSTALSMFPFATLNFSRKSTTSDAK